MSIRVPTLVGLCLMSLVSGAVSAPLRVQVGQPTCRADAAAISVTASGVPVGARRVQVTVRQHSSGRVVGYVDRVPGRGATVRIRIAIKPSALTGCTVKSDDALEVRVTLRGSQLPVRRTAVGRINGPSLSVVDDVQADAPGNSAPSIELVTIPAPAPVVGPTAPALLLPGITRTVSGAVGAPVTEASGLAWSQSEADVFWTHNDSGDSARVFAVGWDGIIRATLPLAGVVARDIEDIALGTDPGGAEALFVADIGDNSAVRASIDVYRVAEPSVLGLPAGTTLGAVAPHVIQLSYPDGARDAEALVADRTTGDLYVITKRETRSRVYRVTAAQIAAGTGVMRLVGEMPYGGVVGADACAGGTTVVVKTYDAVRVHQSPLGLVAALMDEGSARPYVREPQGEAIAVDAACESYVTLSEGLGQPLVRYAP